MGPLIIISSRNKGKLEIILKKKREKCIPTFTANFNVVLGFLANATKQEKDKKD